MKLYIKKKKKNIYFFKLLSLELTFRIVCYDFIKNKIKGTSFILFVI